VGRNCNAIWGDKSFAQKIYSKNNHYAPNVISTLPEIPQDQSSVPIAMEDVSVVQMDSREEFRTRSLGAVDDSWRINVTTQETKRQNRAEESAVERKLHSIIIPKICLRDVPLQDAVDLLAELSEKFDAEEDVSLRGISIALLDQPPPGSRVHITLRNSTLGNVLRLLTQSVGFDYDIADDTVVLSSAEKNGERLQTQTFPIGRAAVLRMTNLRQPGTQHVRHHVDGEQMAREERLLREFFQNAGVDFQRLSGSGLAFDGSSLIVTQTPRNLKRISMILQRYECAKQVTIETKFVEVQQSVLEELQLRWSIANRHGRTGTGQDSRDNVRSLAQAFSPQSGSTGEGSIVLAAGLDGGSPGSRGIIPFANQPPSMPNGVNLAYESVPLVDAMGVIGGTQIGAVLRALEQHAGSDLMSAPKVTVLSGKTAEIVVAQEFRYPEEYDAIQSSVGNGSSTNASTSAGVTITAGTPRNFKTRNIGVEMTVTPIVEEDDRISLQLAPMVTEFEGFVEYGGSSIAVSGGATVTVPSGFFQPIFSTRRIQTEVTIDDGATVVMGGLTREEVKEVRDKIPLLGDLPLFGKLFRSSGKTSQKRNLLIFVTAKLVKPCELLEVDGEIVRESQNNREILENRTKRHRTSALQ
jgi:general secretion pathway protein D